MMQTELEKMFEKVDLTLLNRWGWHGLLDLLLLEHPAAL